MFFHQNAHPHLPSPLLLFYESSRLNDWGASISCTTSNYPCRYLSNCASFPLVQRWLNRLQFYYRLHSTPSFPRHFLYEKIGPNREPPLQYPPPASNS